MQECGSTDKAWLLLSSVWCKMSEDYSLVGYKGGSGSESGICYSSEIKNVSNGVREDSPYARFMNSYALAHRRCPNCGSDKCIQTLVGYTLIIGNEHEYKDLNDSRCGCEFKHTVHDRISDDEWNVRLSTR